MKRLPRPAGLMVAAALISATPALAVATLTVAPAATVVTATASTVATASNISWD